MTFDPSQPTRILMIEDEAHLAEIQRRLLLDAGFEVHWAKTGSEGLELAQQLIPDIVLLDIRLPDTNGYLICKMIKENPDLDDTFVVIITSSAVKSEDQAKGLEMGADGYIIRPIPNRELIARIVSYERIIKNEKALRAASAELNRLNESLTRSNDDLQEFAYAISHDLQEPLRMITSFLSLLERRYGKELDDNAREYIDFAVDGAERMKEMIGGVQSLSRVSTAGHSFEVFSSQVACQAALANLRALISQTGAEINSETLPEVFGDRIQIIQVFQNLISNGIKFNERTPPKIWIQAENEGHQIRFMVKDNGIGMPADSQDQIFGLYSRLHPRKKYPGVGVGLSICKRIIDRHGGQIWMDSTPGEGSAFFFTLPNGEGRQDQELAQPKESQ